MKLTYKVRGADGKEYGPVSLEEVAAWLRDNRIGGGNEVSRSDMSHWARAQDFVELQPHLSRQPAAPPAFVPNGAQVPAVDPALAARVRSGAAWFYWIAGLSLVNSVVALTGSSWRFILGLGITQVFDVFGNGFGGGGKIVVFVLAAIVASVFILFGVFASKRHSWAFIIGMVLFGLDGGISLLLQDWLSLGFHAFAMFGLYGGFAACRKLKTA